MATARAVAAPHRSAARDRIDHSGQEQRMHQRGQHIAADDELEAEKSRQSEIAQQPARLPHVHQPGLDPAFEPARALAQPGAELRRRLLIGGRIDHARSIAEARQPHAEIGILGDVIGIPAADLAQRRGMEMIGRAAERQRQPQRGQSRQEHVELPGIFRRVETREPAVGGVVDAQPRLHASQIVAAGAECLQGAAKLVRLRPVLGVIDHREGAARERQRDVECLRLGARAGASAPESP